MIDLRRYIDTSTIMGELSARTKEEAIKMLVEAIFSGPLGQGRDISREKVLEEILSREKMSTTGIGRGFAIPHARIEGWGDFAIAIGVCRNGLDFESLDGEPTKIICLMISSVQEPYVILQTTATLINFFEKYKGVDKFISAYRSPKDMVNQLRSFHVDTETQILAKDIIRPVQCKVNLDDSIEKATRYMHLRRFDVLPVMDEQNKFCGEISCFEIFKHGMPDFFENLHTVSFVRHIDPFENYFRVQRDLKVRNFYKKTVSISQDRTLIEIIFELTVKKRLKLFVTDEEKNLLGVIDRFTIIDKILVF
ncbi:MAG: PTS sugar transporter subunit IIA [Candidatus Omnitrophota bacterium]